MIKSEDLYKIFKKHNFTYFTGIPDSTFKGWLAFLYKMSQKGEVTNRIAVNECEAIFLAGAYHIATGNIGIVYLQNSGLGNTIDPLTSFADTEVYKLPMLLIIGWRGEPGTKDEPQHKKMGKITFSLLEILDIPYKILPDNIGEIENITKDANNYMTKQSRPYAVVVRRGLIEDEQKASVQRKYEMLREDAIKLIADNFLASDLIISTTGRTSRELWEYRQSKKQTHARDFLNIGSMGGASSEGLEIALQKPSRRIFVLDGDGAILMQMGSLATIGYYQAKNFFHIIFNNNSHESTGGQPTVSNSLSFNKLALASGYKSAVVVDTKDALLRELKQLKEGPAMIIIKIDKGSRENLGRPTIQPQENKLAFMKNLRTKNG